MWMHWEMWGKASSFFHFRLLPLLLSDPPEKIGPKTKINLFIRKKTIQALTFSGFEVDSVGDNVLQFHEFQLCLGIAKRNKPDPCFKGQKIPPQIGEKAFKEENGEYFQRDQSKLVWVADVRLSIWRWVIFVKMCSYWAQSCKEKRKLALGLQKKYKKVNGGWFEMVSNWSRLWREESVRSK